MHSMENNASEKFIAMCAWKEYHHATTNHVQLPKAIGKNLILTRILKIILMSWTRVENNNLNLSR